MSRSPKKPQRPRRHPAPDADERDLFRQAVGPVEQLVNAPRRRPERPLPSSRPRRADQQPHAAPPELIDAPEGAFETEAGDALAYRAGGVQQGVLRRLRRGRYPLYDEIDLHGMVVALARESLAVFLADALGRGARCVRVVHGKGRSSGARGPVLKTKVAGWLEQHPDVLAYVSARPAEGGHGALRVLLRQDPARVRSDAEDP